MSALVTRGEASPSFVDAARLAAFVNASPSGHFLQYPRASGAPAGDASEVVHVWAERDGVVSASALVELRRPARLGPPVGRVECGPVADDPESFAAVLEAVTVELRRRRAISWRLNPYVRRAAADPLVETLSARGFTLAKDDASYRTTLEVDLEPEPETILAAFRKGARSAIKQAGKAGVACDAEPTPEGVAAFAALYDAMVVRKGATLRPAGFFETLGRFVAADPRRGFLLVSRYEGRVVGGIFVLVHGPRAIYAFGASADERDGIPKTHLLHYEAMRRARAAGCTIYDLGGFSAGAGTDEERTVVQRINLFKSGFTKNAVDLIPCYEQILRPALHRGAMWVRAKMRETRQRRRGAGGER